MQFNDYNNNNYNGGFNNNNFNRGINNNNFNGGFNNNNFGSNELSQEKIEAAKACGISAAWGVLAAVPFIAFNEAVDTLAEWQFSIGMYAAELALFGAVYRCVVRSDDNAMLRQGAVGAAALCRAFAAVPLSAKWTSVMTMQLFSSSMEGAVVFGCAAAGLEYAWNRGLARPLEGNSRSLGPQRQMYNDGYNRNANGYGGGYDRNSGNGFNDPNGYNRNNDGYGGGYDRNGGNGYYDRNAGNGQAYDGRVVPGSYSGGNAQGYRGSSQGYERGQAYDRGGFNRRDD